MATIKATPAEIEITAIVGELVHDGFMDLDQADIITLEQRTHAGYKHIADLFVLWALALILRRKTERMADYARLVAEAEGRPSILFDSPEDAKAFYAALENDEWEPYTTTTEDV